MLQSRAHKTLSLLVFLSLTGSQAIEDPEPVAGKPENQITEKLGEPLPGNIALVDEQGQTVELKEFFQPGKPVIIAPAYYNCPRLCTLVYNGLAQAMAETADIVQPGQDYTVLSISFNPEDTSAIASAKAEAYRKSLPEGSRQGWHFLTGQTGPAELLSRAGYGYKKDGDEFIHQAALILLAPDGRIMRYLYGVEFPRQDFTFALMEASQGRIGNTVQKILLSCFRYDSVKGKYAPYAFGFVRLASLFVLAGLVGLIIFLRYQKRS